MTFDELYQQARALAKDRVINQYVHVAKVGAALETKDGNLYTGVNLDIACGIGFCAEHTAIADMIKHGETDIVKLIAVDDTGTILPPCGRCRELVNQIGNNALCMVMVARGNIMPLRSLLPNDWRGNNF